MGATVSDYRGIVVLTMMVREMAGVNAGRGGK